MKKDLTKGKKAKAGSSPVFKAFEVKMDVRQVGGFEETEIVLDKDDLYAIYTKRQSRADSCANRAREFLSWGSGSDVDYRQERVAMVETSMRAASEQLAQAKKVLDAIKAIEEGESCTAYVKAKARILWTPCGVSSTATEAKS